jgi:ABC-type transport system involved in multi-copper enzyme maturation permease subunit
MTVDLSTTPAAPAKGHGDWHVTWHGIRTVSQLELRQRIRSTRWKVALVVWFVVVGAVTGLTVGALHAATRAGGQEAPELGPLIFGIVGFFVRFLGLLVAPTLSAASINGDRAAGTLATLQATLLSPAEIVLGKLLAAWVAALAFLAMSVPFIVWALFEGGVRVLSLVTTLLMLAVVLLVVCAIGLGYSALVAKTSGSAVLTYLTVGGLSVLTPVLFALSAPLVTSQEDVRVWTLPASAWPSSELDPQPTADQCRWETERTARVHTERTWWLLAPNPFVVVADSQPLADTATIEQSGSVEPLALIQYGVRMARTGSSGEEDWCTGQFTEYHADGTITKPESPVAEVEPSDRAVWPWGLGFLLVAGAGAVAVAVRRLRIPTRTLPQGTRVA